MLLISKALKTDLPPELWSSNVCGTESVSGIECLHPSDIQNITMQLESNGSHSGLSSSLLRSEQMPADFTYSMLFLVGLGTASFALFTVAFRPKYRRVEAEQEKVRSNSTLELGKVNAHQMQTLHGAQIATSIDDAVLKNPTNTDP